MVVLILETIIGCDNVKVTEIDKKLEKLEKQREELENQRQQAFVDEGKAFHCKICSKIITKDRASSHELKSQQCYRCTRKQEDDNKKKEIIKKLQYGKVVDIDFASFSTSIRSIFVHKHGITYEVIALGSDDSFLQIESDCKEDISIEDVEIKPWMKKRVEKPLW